MYFTDKEKFIAVLILCSGLFQSCSPKISTTITIPNSTCSPGKQVFDYTGLSQTFSLPANCSSSPSVLFKMLGAGVGDYLGSTSGAGRICISCIEHSSFK